MKLPWRSYCPICDCHIKSLDWTKVYGDKDGLHYGKCPECETLLQKHNILDEEGFDRIVRTLDDQS